MTQDPFTAAKLISEYGTLIAIAAVFIWQQITSQKTLIKIERYFDGEAMKNVNLDQARGIISVEMERAKCEITLEIIRIKINNHLDETDRVNTRIDMFVDRAYSAGVSHCRKFEYQGKPLAMFFESAWKEIVKNQMRLDCQDHAVDMPRMDAIYSAIFNRFKTAFNDKIDEE